MSAVMLEYFNFIYFDDLDTKCIDLLLSNTCIHKGVQVHFTGSIYYIHVLTMDVQFLNQLLYHDAVH